MIFWRAPPDSTNEAASIVLLLSLADDIETSHRLARLAGRSIASEGLLYWQQPIRSSTGRREPRQKCPFCGGQKDLEVMLRLFERDDYAADTKRTSNNLVTPQRRVAAVEGREPASSENGPPGSKKLERRNLCAGSLNLLELKRKLARLSCFGALLLLWRALSGDSSEFAVWAYIGVTCLRYGADSAPNNGPACGSRACVWPQ